MVNIKELKEKVKIVESLHPTLFNVNLYFESCGVVGEYETRLTQFIALVMANKSVGLESLSGAGKSVVVDPLIKLYPPNKLFKMELASKTADFYREEEIKDSWAVYIPELQKAMNNELTVEILKNWGEEKDIERHVRDQVNDTIINQNLPYRPFIYTLAFENKEKTDEEFARRVIHLTTDISAAQTREVNKREAKKRFLPSMKWRITEKEIESLKDYIIYCYNGPKFKYKNPLSNYIETTIPPTFVVSRTAVRMYFDLIEGITRFHMNERIKHHDFIFVTPSDCWMLHRIYGTQFLHTILQVPISGMRILRLFDRISSKSDFDGTILGNKINLTVGEVQTKLRQDGIVLKQGIIQDILNKLIFAGYLECDMTMRTARFFKSDVVEKFESNIDWAEAVEKATKNIREVYPEIAEEYITKFCTSPIETVDPISGIKIDILSKTDLPNIIVSPVIELVDTSIENWIINRVKTQPFEPENDFINSIQLEFSQKVNLEEIKVKRNEILKKMPLNF